MKPSDPVGAAAFGADSANNIYQSAMSMWGQPQVPVPNGPSNLIQTLAMQHQQQQQSQHSQAQQAQLAAMLGAASQTQQTNAYVNILTMLHSHGQQMGASQQQQLAAMLLSQGAGALSSTQVAATLAALQQQQQSMQQQQHVPSHTSLPLAPRSSGNGAGSVPPTAAQQQAVSRSLSGGSRSPAFASGVATPQPPMGVADWITGYGTVTWLSSQAGLLESSELGTVSFQLKQFCDAQVSDLTSVLRPGYKLRFNAVQAAGGAEPRAWTATFVVPVTLKDGEKCGELKAELEHYAKLDTGPPSAQKEQYSVELEAKAIPLILAIFQKQGATQTQLGNFHCHISNCGDANLYSYIGTSSLKRRQFMERRTQLFHLSPQDLVSLQPPAVHALVHALAARLLARGGVTAIHELYEYYCSCGDIPLDARELIGESKTGFLQFIKTHPWIFVVFPSRVFVAVRRELPEFDYAQFIEENFAGHELRAPTPVEQSGSPTNGAAGVPGAGPPAIQRKASNTINLNRAMQQTAAPTGWGDVKPNAELDAAMAGYYGQQNAQGHMGSGNFQSMQQNNVQPPYYQNSVSLMPNGVQRTTSAVSAANFWERPAPVGRSVSSHVPPQRCYVTERQAQTDIAVPNGYTLYLRPPMHDAVTQTNGDGAEGEWGGSGSNGGSRLSPVVGGGAIASGQAEETKSGSTPTSGVRSASSSVFDEVGHVLQQQAAAPQPPHDFGAFLSGGQRHGNDAYNPFGFGLDSMDLLSSMLGQGGGRP